MDLYLNPKIIRDKLGRFTKNSIPENKGTKGVLKKNKTSFKKGHLPFNTKYDGAISIRGGYKYIRVSKGKWLLLHRHIWTLENGKIPKKHLIIFKDKNKLNCTIDNLECISMTENRNRNINYKKAALTIKKRWKDEKLRHKYGLKLNTKLLDRCK